VSFAVAMQLALFALEFGEELFTIHALVTVL
jgi:hypothetical protein